MEIFINDYLEPVFSIKETAFNKAEKTFSELLSKPNIKFYRKVITARRITNRILRIPQRIDVFRISTRIELIDDDLKDRFEPTILSKNMIAEHRKFKNKTIISVKTDIETKFLKRI